MGVAAEGVEPEGVEPEGAEPEGAEPEGAEPEGVAALLFPVPVGSASSSARIFIS
jgi:hypothetical protein